MAGGPSYAPLDTDAAPMAAGELSITSSTAAAACPVTRMPASRVASPPKGSTTALTCTLTREPFGSMVTVAPAGPAVRALRMISAAGSPRAAARAAAPATSVQRSCAATQPTAQSAPQSTSTRTGSATAISAVAVPPSTAEMAVALPVLVLVLCGALWAVGCVAAQLRCTDVAGAAARAAARGEPAAEIIRRARTAGPAGATVTIEPNGSRVSVQVSAVVRPFGGRATRLAGIRGTGQAAAAVEEVIDSSPAAMGAASVPLSLIHISEPTRLGMISYAVFCLKKKK